MAPDGTRNRNQLEQAFLERTQLDLGTKPSIRGFLPRCTPWNSSRSKSSKSPLAQ